MKERAAHAETSDTSLLARLDELEWAQALRALDELDVLTGSLLRAVKEALTYLDRRTYDMFGARVEQLPLIWARLVDAGFEPGHAYGKSLRTVKSCVGSTWCRYGVQDSVRMAID
ncbi:hypothetical protein PV343_06400, partial [Streptomyces sp. WI03-4A]|uniref:hypothetical protein n=1 Tax=Streptomyces sp. WI03-4A TaxID=3028706 RepID=UPI0029AD994D